MSSSELIMRVLDGHLPPPVRHTVPVRSNFIKPKIWAITRYQMIDVKILKVGTPSKRKFREINGLAGLMNVDGNVFAGSNGGQVLIKI